MDPRLLQKTLEGWWCIGQMQIGDFLVDDTEEVEGEGED